VSCQRRCLPLDQWDKLNFRDTFCDAIARKIGIGADLAEGTLEAAKKWERLEEDLNSGALRMPAYGASWHHSLPGVEWAYSYIFSCFICSRLIRKMIRSPVPLYVYRQAELCFLNYDLSITNEK
jgi:hypothetical protein